MNEPEMGLWLCVALGAVALCILAVVLAHIVVRFALRLRRGDPAGVLSDKGHCLSLNDYARIDYNDTKKDAARKRAVALRSAAMRAERQRGARETRCE